MRWLVSLADFILDTILWSAPRKGNLFPIEDITGPPSEPGLEQARRYVANDLLNGPSYPRCTCLDCECGFNKTDPQARPGRGVE